MSDHLTLREIRKSDCSTIHEAFKTQGWNKPISQYERYLQFQESGNRDVIIAEVKGSFAGYLTINWIADYEPFHSQGIPEIVDLNVLKKFQRRGIANSLLDEAESRIKKVSPLAGIGFGLYKDYGPAQIIYVQRGYVPDGNGVVKDDRILKKGEQFTLDDSIVLFLTKQL